jgi:uncharacterized protein (DUF433 family)
MPDGLYRISPEKLWTKFSGTGNMALKQDPRGIEIEKLDRITINPSVCLGQPTIRGMRVTVSVILKMMAGGKTIEDVLKAYPELEAEEIRQAIQYAAWIVSDQIHMVPTI